VVLKEGLLLCIVSTLLPGGTILPYLLPPRLRFEDCAWGTREEQPLVDSLVSEQSSPLTLTEGCCCGCTVGAGVDAVKAG